MSIFRRYLPKALRPKTPLVPVLRLTGVIGGGGRFGRGLSLAGVASPLARLFSYDAPVVAISINSPGGSPVQSRLIHDRIRKLAEEKEKDVVVMVEDVGASGGYMLACAGDEIICDESSILGSIGVISAGFGLDRVIERWGIERRVYTAGDKKLALDPFQPEKPDDIRRLKAIQKQIHDSFVGLVKTRREGRIDADDKQLFTGEFWAGEQAVALGLADRVANLDTVMRERLGEKVKLVAVPMQRRGLGALFRSQAPLGGAQSGIDAFDPSRWSDALVDSAVSAAQERTYWGRFGL
ncbi:MAG: S49 family peptidase [Devosiaceae bacterium]|nr:S49 family peptidase [Devosiaceae bacterium MH13]